MARRWCVVEQDDQHDLFVSDPWHMHLADVNVRLDVPRERTLCGDLLPARPVYRELVRPLLKVLCPQCQATARSLRARPADPSRKLAAADSASGNGQIDLYTDSGASGQ
ncbi:hypothetical protein KEM63_09455 [Halopseudomonas nanhaiensis]|uniref:hypothetical protein n=1 Tax=Halopseudomonas nanhaiensis TaxID=2830842 RepID=UPI001CBDC8F9|nr:hypothetical protein [Halopseudomonas nanhaiensis]UAW97061.1 hypothetical protein KEM63_09455 [Halopseudomonas nanhaiensis]